MPSGAQVKEPELESWGLRCQQVFPGKELQGALNLCLRTYQTLLQLICPFSDIQANHGVTALTMHVFSTN